MLELTIQDIYDVLNKPCNHPTPNARISCVVRTPSSAIRKSCVVCILPPRLVEGGPPQTAERILENENKWIQAGQKLGAHLFITRYPHPGVNCIQIDNPFHAFLNIAALQRSRLSMPLVAITGSNGKTTTKEMLLAALRFNEPNKLFQTTPGNANTPRNLSSSLLTYQETTPQAIIYECAGYSKGRLQRVSKMIRPTIAAITMIGSSHIGNLGSREALFLHKREILSGMDKDGIFILNKDCPFLRRITQESIQPRLLTVSTKYPADVTADRIRFAHQSLLFDIVYKNQYYPINMGSIGPHNVTNVLIAFTICLQLGLSIDKAIKGLQSYRTSGIRQHLQKRGPYTLLADCYNSAPEPLFKSIEFFEMLTPSKSGRRIAVISAIAELGDHCEQLHIQIGQFLNKSKKLDRIYFYGPDAIHMYNQITNPQISVSHTVNSEELIENLRNELRPGDSILFKGSHCFHLETIIDNVFNEDGIIH